jgi:Lon protease-like protein
MSGETNPLDDFGGVARLFPLPNLVFFPRVVQPLHIFEARYRQMTADALASDRLIALVKLCPGWEEAGSEPPAIHLVACLGRIAANQKLHDGRYNLLLQGLSRIRVVRELTTDRLYRSAEVELLHDRACSSPEIERALRLRLVEQMPTWFVEKGPVVEQFEKLLQSDLTLGALCDVFGFALPIDSDFKQMLLEELEVETRARLLLEHMKKIAPLGDRKFPPDFSPN